MARVAADILCLMQMSTGLNDENILSLRIPMSKIISLLKKKPMFGRTQDGAKPSASEEGRTLLGAKITLYTVLS